MNTTLPISGYQAEIVNSVANNAVTILTAETGSGKSTQVPQFLAEAGYNVVVTEPRRMAAWSLAERVAEETNTEVGDIIGFRTGFERKDSPKTSILYCTDGLELVRTLAETKHSRNKVLVIDEVHEWNLNIETLVAWCKKKVHEGWCTKVVIMSATLEKESLAKYFGKGVNTLQVPGKLFPVKIEERYGRNWNDEAISEVINEMVVAGRNTLVFVEGKARITKITECLNSLNTEAVILPLHGELNSFEQKKCFKNYALPKVIIATNIAQTSITVPDIDAVIDTGLENRVEVHNGVEGLFTRNISKADCLQRLGRAGRTKEGIYILCSNTLLNEREEFAVPEIQRGILDQIVLRLANCGIDATELEFFHQPKKESLKTAKETLINLGALSEDNEVTTIGKKMAKMLISVRAARMIVEAEKYGVTDEVICIAAIMEIGGLLKRKTNYYEFTNETSSDLLAEFDVWNRLNKMKFIKFDELGVIKKSYNQINYLIEKMHNVLEGVVKIESSPEDRVSIRKACIAGMMDLVHKNRYDEYINGDEISRRLDRHSCMAGWNMPRLLVGKPRIITFKDSWGDSRTMEVISTVTKVTTEELKEIAPHLLREEDSEPCYFSSIDAVQVTRTTYFKNMVISEEEVIVPNHPDYEKLKKEHEEYERARKESERSRREYLEKLAVSDHSYHESKQQEYIQIDGKEFKVSYDWRGTASISIDKYTLFNTDTRTVALDDGKKVEIYYAISAWSGKKNNNIVSLRNAVEKEMIKSAWEEKRNNLPSVKSGTIKSAVEVMQYIGKQEVTRGNGGYGEQIYGFGCLVLNKNSVHLELLEDEEKAKEKTQEVTEFLYGKFIRENFSEKRFKFRKGIKGLSRKEQKVKDEFDSEVHELLNGLDIGNIEERAEYLKELYDVVIEDLKIVAA